MYMVGPKTRVANKHVFWYVLVCILLICTKIRTNTYQYMPLFATRVFGPNMYQFLNTYQYDHQYIPICTNMYHGMYWLVLACIGQYWTVLVCIQYWYVVVRTVTGR